MPTFKISTLGCKVNQYETQVIREQLIGAGFSESNVKSKAGLCVINTCTVTQKADAESLNLIRRAMRENPQAKIFVSGCLVELDAARVKKLGLRIKIIRNRKKQNITQYIPGKKGIASIREGISYFKGHNRAFLKVQDGCNNNCSYCKVPLVRGASRSRPAADIIVEARRIVTGGTKEIVLSGICLGAYGRDLKPALDLTALLEKLKIIKGLERIRLSSIEAGDVSERLIIKIARSAKICRHLHIPIQSGDDKILKLMGRSYTRSYYLKLIQKIKRRIPGIAITTDVLIGFPQEERSNFKNTLELVTKICPLKTHIFPYSIRPGTAASRMKGILAAAEIKLRFQKLQKIAQACSVKYRRGFIGKTLDTLIEGHFQDRSDLWQGHTDNYLKVVLKSNRNLKNKIIEVRLKELCGDYIRAVLA